MTSQLEVRGMRRTLYAILLVILIVSSPVFVNSIHPVHASTVPPSIISSDTIWTVANSPYSLSGPTLVSAGVTLTIEAGATVNLNTYYLQVNGTLSARGTSTSQIYINSATVNVGQIKFTASSTSWNEQSGTGCIIQNAIINQTVISTTNCSIKVNGNTFNDAADMTHVNVAITTSGGSSIISNNNFNACGLDIGDSSTISNNVIGGGMGIYGGSPVVSQNTISGGSSYFWIGRSYDRDYYTVAIEDQCSPTLISNTINGPIAFDMDEGGYGVFNALITGNTIAGIGVGAGSGTVIISSNVISGSGINANTAITTAISNNLLINAITGLQIGNATVQNNTIANCQIAISLNYAGSPIISGNNIENSSQYNLKLVSTSKDVDASNNWWGTTDTQAISQSIYDQKNDFNLGKVNFTPILNTPNPLDPPVTATQLAPTTSPSSPTPTANSTTASPTPTTPKTSSTATSTATTASTPSAPEFSIMSLIVLLVVATLAIGVGSKKLSRKSNTIDSKKHP